VFAVDAVHRGDQRAQTLKLVDVIDVVTASIGIERDKWRRPHAHVAHPIALRGRVGVPDNAQVRLDLDALAQRRRIERRVLVRATLEPCRLRAPLQAPAERVG
jgi:hypothetical protein